MFHQSKQVLAHEDSDFASNLSAAGVYIKVWELGRFKAKDKCETN